MSLNQFAGLTTLPSSLGPIPTSNSSLLIPQNERLATVRPRTALPGEAHQYAYFKLRNYTSAKTTTHSSMKGIQNALTNTNGPGFASFLLQHFEFRQVERTQLVAVFGGGVAAYFFGTDPIMLSINGMLVDDIDNQWFVQFGIAYNEFMRGTALAAAREELDLFLPSMQITGPILDFQVSQDAARWTDIPFSCTILVQKFAFRPVISGGQILGPSIFTQGSGPTLSMSAIQNSKAAVLSATGTTGTNSAAAFTGTGALGAATAANASVISGLGAAPAINALAVSGLAAQLETFQPSVVIPSHGFVNTPFSKVFGFIQAFSGYVQNVSSFIQAAIQSSGIGTLSSMIAQVDAGIIQIGAGVGSAIGSLDSLLGNTIATVVGVISPLTSLPSVLAQAFYYPLANLHNLSFSFSSFINQVTNLPANYVQNTKSMFGADLSLVVPLIPQAPYNASATLNAGLSGGSTGSNSAAIL